MPIFSVRNASLSLARAQTGVWDKVTNVGTEKQGEAVVEFNKENLSQFVKNFASQKNDVPGCLDHLSAMVEQTGAPAPAAAWYNAMTLVLDGAVVEFASHDSNVSAPDASTMSDGVWAHRAELTPLGDKMIECYRYVSPFFTTEGKDEFGNPLGFQILDIAWTNIPHQDGVGLAMHKNHSPINKTRSPASSQKDKTMANAANPDLLAKYGLAADCTPEQMTAGMAKYAEDMEAKMKKMGDDLDAMKKMSADDEKADPEKDNKAKEFDKEPDGDEKKAMSALGAKLGLSATASRSEILQAANVGSVPMSQLPAMIDKRVNDALAADRAARDAQQAQQHAEALVSQAVEGGYPDADKAAMVSFAQKSPEAAQRILAPFIAKGAELFNRVTHAGAPAGAARPAAATGTKVMQYGQLKVVRHGCDISAEAKKIALARNLSFEKAMDIVVAEKPEMYAAYLAAQ